MSMVSQSPPGRMSVHLQRRPAMALWVSVGQIWSTYTSTIKSWNCSRMLDEQCIHVLLLVLLCVVSLSPKRIHAEPFQAHEEPGIDAPEAYRAGVSEGEYSVLSTSGK